MGLKLVTAPVGMPVSVDQAKAQSRITYSDAAQDDLIAGNIQSAVLYVQQRLGRQLMTATYTYYCDKFPCGGRALELPVAPVIAISDVSYVGTGGALASWDSSLWTSDVVSEPARLQPVFNGYWPTIQQTLNAVQVTFTAGYGNAGAVPTNIKTAILMLAAHYYENREAAVDVKQLPVPYAVDAHLDLYRWHPNSFATL